MYAAEAITLFHAAEVLALFAPRGLPRDPHLARRAQPHARPEDVEAAVFNGLQQGLIHRGHDDAAALPIAIGVRQMRECLRIKRSRSLGLTPHEFAQRLAVATVENVIARHAVAGQ